MPPHTISKVHRWIDLLGFLLRRRAPITFGEIRRGVAQYARVSTVAAHRAFERDKRELRAMHIPLETTLLGYSSEIGYRLRRADVGLPTLRRAGTGGSARLSAPERSHFAGAVPLADMAPPRSATVISERHWYVLQRLCADLTDRWQADSTVPERARRVLRVLNRDLAFSAMETLVPNRSIHEDASHHLLLLFDVLPMLPLDTTVSRAAIERAAGPMARVVIDFLNVTEARPEATAPAESGCVVTASHDGFSINAPLFARPLRPTMSDLVALRVLADLTSHDRAHHAEVDHLVDHLSALALRTLPMSYALADAESPPPARHHTPLDVGRRRRPAPDAEDAS